MSNRELETNLGNRRTLAEVIRKVRPDIMFGPVLPDRHPDHVATAELVEAARFQAKLCKTDIQDEPYWVPKHYAYYSTHRCDYSRPSLIVDVTDCWNKKIEAVQAYQSQLQEVTGGSISLVEKVEAVGKYFGQSIGSKYGEPFVTSEPIGIKNAAVLLDI